MKFLRLAIAFGLLTLALNGPLAFAQYSSPNYSSNEVFFGSGGDTGQSSTSYQAQASVGALGVGTGSSANYKAYSGFLTPGDPFLELGIDTSLVNLGTLSTTTASTGTADFHVRAYVDSGYTIQTIGAPPTETSGTGSHTLTAMSVQAGSSPGTEQFGINLVHNTSPITFGIDPSPQPDSTFATGVAATGYSTADQFKYVIGDTIATSSGSGWGATNFTIAYIANINLVTPAGNYTMTHDLVVVATY